MLGKQYILQTSRCLKIKEKVSFKFASEVSYVYILSGQKFEKVRHFGWFSNTLNLGKNGDIILVLNLDLNFAGNNNASGSMIDDKSKQWFGASVHSSGPDGIIVVNFKTYRENSTLLEHNCNYHPKANFTAGDSLAFQWWMAGV